MDNEQNKKEPILSVKDLRVSFKTDEGLVHAVRGVSFDLYKGETLCIVGESGSGKSVTSKTIMGILSANAVIEEGSVMYQGEDLTMVDESEFHRIRGHKIGMVFQDPLSSLNPIMKVGKQITEAMLINSNRLKNLYDSIISKEEAAYKNAEAKKRSEYLKADRAIEASDENFDKEIYALVRKEKELAFDLSQKENVLTLLLRQWKIEEQKYLQQQKLLEKKQKSQKKDDKQNKDDKQKKTEKAKTIKKFSDPVLESKIKEARLIRDTAAKTLDTFSAQAKVKTQELNKKKASEHKRLSVLARERKKKADEVYKASAPALKKALEDKKKVADEEVKKYKAEKTKEYEEEVKRLSSGKISDEEYNSIIREENASYEKDLEDLKNKQTEEINQLEADYNSKTDQLQKNHASAEDLTEAKKAYLDSLERSQKKLNQAKAERIKQHEEKLADAKEQHTHEKALEKAKLDYKAKFRISRAEAKAEALKVMKEVGIPQPEVRFNQYPFEFSGGMRQRIVIAIALTANPEILICDEPTTALDVTIQAQILELINKLKKERHMSIIFISHDLGVVANMADRVAVMYAGKIIEVGTAAEIFYDPRHPYTWALLSSIPDIDSHEKLEAIPGTPPYLLNPPKGDAFAARNKYALAIDFEEEPPFFKISETHYAATWLLDKRAPKTVMPKIVSQRIKLSLERAGVKHD